MVTKTRRAVQLFFLSQFELVPIGEVGFALFSLKGECRNRITQCGNDIEFIHIICMSFAWPSC